MNKVILSGYLGADPELRYTPNGKPVCNLSIATNDFYNGESHAEWHKVVIWGKAANIAKEYLNKGSGVIIPDGRLKTRSWEKDGVKQYSTEVHCFFVEFMNRGAKKSTEQFVEDCADIGDDPAPFG